jgi:hypothetical protein
VALIGRSRPVEGRLGQVALAGLALLAGLWAGLVRIGWSLPPLEPNLAALHGPLMVGGFLGVVIGLERAVALGQRWAFGAPSLAGLGSLALLVGLPTQIGAALLVASSAILMVIFGRIYRLRPEWSTILLLAGAAAWLVGNAVWLAGLPVVAAALWWVGFLVLTIVGERLELAQALMPGGRRALLVIAASIVLLGLGLSTVLYTSGLQLTGAGFLVLAVWLLRFDVARRSVGRPGLPRFSGVALRSRSGHGQRACGMRQGAASQAGRVQPTAPRGASGNAARAPLARGRPGECELPVRRRPRQGLYGQ